MAHSKSGHPSCSYC